MLRRLWWTGVRTWSHAGAYAALAVAAGSAHLAEVHLLDARATAFTRTFTGWDFEWFRAPAWEIEPRLQGLVALYYLAAFLALLVWTPGLIAASGDARLLKRTLLCYPLLYLLALPGLLFFPSVNPYSRLGTPSPFETIDPRLEDAYYFLTTRDNTFPSLHVGFTVALAAALWRAWPAWRPAIAVHAALLIASVVIIRVHYVADVAGGIAIGWLAWQLPATLAQSRVGAALDRWSERMAWRESRAWVKLEAWATRE